MEGYNPTLGCASGCLSLRRGWVPYPRSVYPRRDALIDAYGRTDNPCERPARCGPCCDPVPKFRRPKELPECNICCFQEEQQEAKRQQACEEYQKYVKECCPPCRPEMVIEALDPNNPIAVEIPENLPPEQQYIRRELSCRTNIIAGFFNPDDNKTPEQKLKEQCDQTYLSCGPNLPLYPCRGAIEYPRIGWTTVADEMNKCRQPICQESKFCNPEYIQQQIELKQQRELEQRMEDQKQAMEEEVRKRYYNHEEIDPCCPPKRITQMPYCNCGCDF